MRIEAEVDTGKPPRAKGTPLDVNRKGARTGIERAPGA